MSQFEFGALFSIEQIVEQEEIRMKAETTEALMTALGMKRS